MQASGYHHHWKRPAPGRVACVIVEPSTIVVTAPHFGSRIVSGGIPNNNTECKHEQRISWMNWRLLHVEGLHVSLN